MTVQTVKLGRERFVILREKDYRSLKAKADARPSQVRTPRRTSAKDRGDIAEAQRRAEEPSVSLQSVRKRLGL